MLTIITQNKRVFCIGGNIEIGKSNDGTKILLCKVGAENTEPLVLCEDNDTYIVDCVFNQCMGLLRSPYVKVLDFDAMYRNPNIDDYNKGWEFDWDAKRKRGRPRRS